MKVSKEIDLGKRKNGILFLSFFSFPFVSNGG
jgi:hypothetical protein